MFAHKLVPCHPSHQVLSQMAKSLSFHISIIETKKSHLSIVHQEILFNYHLIYCEIYEILLIFLGIFVNDRD